MYEYNNGQKDWESCIKEREGGEGRAKGQTYILILSTHLIIYQKEEPSLIHKSEWPKDDNNTWCRWTETERESGSYFHRHFQNLNPLSSNNNQLPLTLSPSSLPSFITAWVCTCTSTDTTARAVVQYTSSRMLGTTSNILHWLHTYILT